MARFLGRVTKIEVSYSLNCSFEWQHAMDAQRKKDHSSKKNAVIRNVMRSGKFASFRI